MKKMLYFVVFTALLLFFFVSCAGLQSRSGPQIDKPSDVLSDMPLENLPLPAEQSDKLDDPVFAKLPQAVKSYLQNVSLALQNRDTDFLLDQGDAMFEKLVRPYYDDEEYFIMLYGISGDRWDIPLTSDLSRIEFTGWESGDPVIEIRARIVYSDTRIIPCTIMLDWKLDEPKIIGMYP